MKIVQLTDKITAVLGDNIDYMKSIEDHAFNLAIVDPVYHEQPGKKLAYGSEIGKLGVRRPFYGKTEYWIKPTPEFFQLLRRTSIDQIIWGINYYPIVNESFGRIVWDKVNGKSSYSDCELASCSKIQSVRLLRYMWNGMMQGKSIREGHVQQANKKLNEKRIHRTQKPVILYRWLLQEFADPGDRILDTNGGSFSSAIACHIEGFEMVIVEIDPNEFNKGVRRFKDFMKYPDLFYDQTPDTLQTEVL